MKLQIEPYFAFIFFTTKEDEKKIFKFTSIYNILDENLRELEELRAYIVYLYIFHKQVNSLMLDKLKKGRNLPIINQHITGYTTSAVQEKIASYQNLFKYKKSRKEKSEDEATYRVREKKKKDLSKAIIEEIEKMKNLLEVSIAELKKSKKLETYQQGQESEENLAMCGLVQKNNKIHLVIVTQTSDDTKAVYLLPKQLIALIDDISKPIIIQAHKEADRNYHQQASAQVIAHLNLEEGRLEVKEGLLGQVIATKNNITDKRNYKVDIDVLLTYYRIFSYEQASKEEFEKRLYASEIYSSYEID